MTVRIRSFTVPVSCSNLVLPCGAAALASSEAGGADFCGAGWLDGDGASGTSGAAALSGACGLAAAGAGACGIAYGGRQNKLVIAQPKTLRTKKLLKPDSSSLRA